MEGTKMIENPSLRHIWTIHQKPFDQQVKFAPMPSWGWCDVEIDLWMNHDSNYFFAIPRAGLEQ